MKILCYQKRLQYIITGIAGVLDHSFFDFNNNFPQLFVFVNDKYFWAKLVFDLNLGCK